MNYFKNNKTAQIPHLKFTKKKHVCVNERNYDAYLHNGRLVANMTLS